MEIHKIPREVRFDILHQNCLCKYSNCVSHRLLMRQIGVTSLNLYRRGSRSWWSWRPPYKGYCARSAPIVVFVFVWAQRWTCVQIGAVNCKYKQECMYKFKDKWNLKTNLHIYICKFTYSWALFLCTIESLSSKYLESSSYRSTISQLKSLRTLGWMWDPLTIVYNYNTMMMMTMMRMRTQFWWWKGLNWVKRSEIPDNFIVC